MKHTTLKIAGMALAIAASAYTARADIALNPNVSLYGYAAGFIEYNQYPGGATNSDTSMDLRAVRLGLALNFAPVTAKISGYYTGNEYYLLDANATYDFGQGWSVTGGRFLSWFGYEPFDIPKGNFITNGNEIPDLLPNFHEGVRLDYAIDTKSSVGIAIVDSIYNAYSFTHDSYLDYSSLGGNLYRGDGKLSDGYGVEAHYGYNDGALSIGVTAAYQNTRGYSSTSGATFPSGTYSTMSSMSILKDTYVGDIWAQYIIQKNTLVAAELVYKYGKEDDYNLTQYYGLVTVKQQINDKFSLALRGTTGSYKYKANGGGDTGNIGFWKISFTPAYAVTQNLSVAAEISYSKYNSNWKDWNGLDKDSNAYVGVQACLHF